MTQELTTLEKQLSDLKQVATILSDPDLLYAIRKYAAAYETLLTKYARFKAGDRVQLARTPDLSNSPGWQGSAHFLVQGAQATVTHSDFNMSSHTICYHISFDSESWIDSKSQIQLIPERDRHSYYFPEHMLAPISERAYL